METTQLYSISELDFSLKSEISSLASKTSSFDILKLEHSLLNYDFALLHFSNNRLVSCQLLDMFMIGHKQYIYFGILFSRGANHLNSFLNFITSILNQSTGLDIYMMAEIQSIQALVCYRSLFQEYTIQNKTKEAYHLVDTFAQKIKHIQGYNAENFNTSSKYTLYQYSHKYQFTINWLLQQNIHLEQAQNYLLLIKIPKPSSTKEKILQILKSKVKEYQTSPSFRSNLLKTYQYK